MVTAIETTSMRDDILARIAFVPPLPTASIEVIRLALDPDVSDARIAQAIQYDPSLTTNVLRLANSAYFGFPRSVSTLREAFLRRGTNRVFQLVLTATIGKMAQMQVRGYDLSGGDLWDHLIGTAIGTTKLAEALHLDTPKHTFTAALMHDIGKIVLGTFVEVNAPTVIGFAIKHKVSFELAEQEVLGIDHAEVGACLLEHWNLPEALVKAVRWHHQPEEFSGDPLVVNLVHVADVVCLMTGIGAGIDALSYRPSSNALVQLGLNNNGLESIAYKIINELMEVRKLFKL